MFNPIINKIIKIINIRSTNQLVIIQTYPDYWEFNQTNSTLSFRPWWLCFEKPTAWRSAMTSTLVMGPRRRMRPSTSLAAIGESWWSSAATNRGIPGLVNVDITNWKITIFNGKIHYFNGHGFNSYVMFTITGINWPFSIAMLNYQRVSEMILLVRLRREWIGCWEFFLDDDMKLVMILDDDMKLVMTFPLIPCV